MDSLDSPSVIFHTGQPTFFENPVEKKGIPPPFSVHLTRQKDGSELCFECGDETKIIGETVWIPLLSRVRLAFSKWFDVHLFDTSRSLIGLFS